LLDRAALEEKMELIIVGCGRLGAELAYRLFRKGHSVTVIDHVAAAFTNLSKDFRGRTLEGEVLNRDVLLRAGVETAEGVAVVTNSDTVNLVVGRAAKEIFLVPRVVVRNYDPRLRELHETFQLQTVSSATWGAQRLEDFLCTDLIIPILSMGHGEIEIYEIRIPRSWEGRTTQEVLPEKDCKLIAITRGGRALLPSADFRLEGDDLLHLSMTEECAAQLYEKIREG
jgi:trk system potassium uptake protein TrkA